ncbi:hypothetical protein HBE96_25900 [Clostridium sp. P21]|uniref:Glycerophosphoryl diester phosphodiesterase membrane domain-containing protein n=1 Tax=Clostridium muellerianum TaxID=2716538 RepID=A0A7Y0HSA1_9CLOT|nr:glycerophosphoryl diester phosphodiesterase membrane domain-containing protein [Clostridium muellerianum]NMM66016.1 hypothetical protein [Clostridium muellerianum]
MGLLGLSEIMDTSIEVLRKYMKTIFLFSLGYGVIAGIVAIILIIITAILVAVAYKVLSSFILSGIILVLLCSFIFTFLLAYNVGLIKIASQDFLSERIYADDAIGASFKSIFRVFSILLVVTILFIPVIAVFGVASYFICKGLKYSINSIVIAYGISSIRYVFAIIILILIIIAMISMFWLYVTFISFSLNVAVIEKKYAFSALKRSFNLVKNEFWKIIGCSILFSITIFAVKVSLAGFMEAVLSILYLITSFFNVQVGYTDFIVNMSRYIQFPINLLMWLIIYPLTTIMMCNMYFNQRYKKEGYDIVLRLKEIQKNHERKQEADGI